jgi:hypothetical protein
MLLVVCCELRLLLLRNAAATSEIIPAHLLYEDHVYSQSTLTSCCIHRALYPIRD